MKPNAETSISTIAWATRTVLRHAHFTRQEKTSSAVQKTLKNLIFFRFLENFKKTSNKTQDFFDWEDYLGEIIGIDFKPKREGAFPRGHYLLTALVTSDGKLDDENTRVYTISEATHKEMILAADNTDFKFSWLAA